jgi:phosphatidylserine/phosphatidylglycerophosphate/cardiolipin synthase-like enzyme
MSRRIQFWTGTAAALVLLLGGAGGVRSTTVEPLIDRPGSCRYCVVVAEALDGATESIELVLADAELEENPLWESVVAAHERGVRVRVFLDESEWASSITEDNRPAIEFLQGHGIDARFDDPAVTTHAKLALVDRTTVILGSTNWNRYAFTDQEQANVRIVDARVGEAFGSWFDALWSGAMETEEASIDGNPGAVEVPTIVPLPDVDGSCLYPSTVLPLFDAARRSIHVAMYRASVYAAYSDSSSNALLDALVRAGRRGLDVRVVIDDCKFYADSEAANLMSALYLCEQGIPVRFDDPEETMHAKLVVIDGESVVVGSTNWNYYALERNVEASVALLNMPDVAAAFDDYFEILWQSGRKVGP